MNPEIISADFASLRECVECLQQRFLTSPITVPSIAIDGDAKGMKPIPEFLFRGESGLYPSTVSSMQRLKSLQSLPASVRDELERISINVDRQLQAFWSIGPMLSSGFGQHYGLPTELIDITAGLDVAAFFASAGESGSKGAMAVFSSAVLAQKAIVIDLRQHPCAERLRRQQAYALFHRSYLDFKRPEATEDLKIQWFTFTLQPEDISSFQASTSLLDAHTDKLAGTIQLFLDGYGKFNDWAAEWLSERIPAAPFITTVAGELTSAEEAGVEFCEFTGRFNNRRRWSVQYPNDTPASGGLQWMQSKKGA